MNIKSVFVVSAASLLLCSCSSVLNTLGGLTTFQSTISGSNYPFFVKADGKLSLINEFQPANLIETNQNFEITLDGGFLRYLQASDPYVVIYSKAWIGDNPPPTDDNAYLRQIILVKEGLSFNARLPLSSIPLLGPITMGASLADVHVSLHVVVLSKNSNAETTKLIDQLASTVGTIQPQYAVIAGAAAAIGDAIVSQNKDKIEFEHSYKFSAYKPDSANVLSTAQWTPTLSVGRYVVIKGEDENRLIPYDNWFFYISPFNWLGHKPSIESIRFEMKKGFWDLPYEDANMTLINAPFKLVHQLLLPNESLLGRFNRTRFGDFTNMSVKTQTEPDEIIACGAYLLKVDSNDGKAVNCDTNAGRPVFDSLYTDKTYAIISIKRTDTSYGEYGSLKQKFTQQAVLIDDLKYSTSQQDHASGIAKLQNILAYEATKKKIAADSDDKPVSAKEIQSIQTNKNLSDEEQSTLTNAYLEGQAKHSVKRLWVRIDAWMRGHESQDYVKKDFEASAKRALILEKASWKKACKSLPNFSVITATWTEVLESVKLKALASEHRHASMVATDFTALIGSNDADLKGDCK